MYVNDMNVAASKKHVVEAEVLVAIADDSTPVANSQAMQTRKPLQPCYIWQMFGNNR